MPIPDILTLDFDGVLCDGMQEYFEASRRTYMRDTGLTNQRRARSFFRCFAISDR